MSFRDDDPDQISQDSRDCESFSFVAFEEWLKQFQQQQPEKAAAIGAGQTLSWIEEVRPLYGRPEGGEHHSQPPATPPATPISPGYSLNLPVPSRKRKASPDTAAPRSKATKTNGNQSAPASLLRSSTYTHLDQLPSYRLNPPQCPLTAEEILTFFPNHTLWAYPVWRLYNHGWESRAMMDKIADVWGLKPLRSTISTRISRSAKHMTGNSSWQARQHCKVQVSSMDTDQWSCPSLRNGRGIAGDIQDWSLCKEYKHIPASKMPTGDSCGVFTQCVKYALAYAQDQLTEKSIPCMITQLRLMMPSSAAPAEQDKDALRQFREMMFLSRG